jgi:hypothetical protein
MSYGYMACNILLVLALSAFLDEACIIMKPVHSCTSNKPHDILAEGVLVLERNVAIQLHSTENGSNALNMAGFHDHQELEVTYHPNQKEHEVKVKVIMWSV